MIGLVAGVAVGVLGTVLFVILRPSPRWQEQSVRYQAETLGCNYFAHGLNPACVPVATLRKAGPGTWIAMYGNAQHRVCLRLHPVAEPFRRQSCP